MSCNFKWAYIAWQPIICCAEHILHDIILCHEYITTYEVFLSGFTSLYLKFVNLQYLKVNIRYNNVICPYIYLTTSGKTYWFHLVSPSSKLILVKPSYILWEFLKTCMAAYYYVILLKNWWYLRFYYTKSKIYYIF
jgi:hypothetical protein